MQTSAFLVDKAMDRSASIGLPGSWLFSHPWLPPGPVLACPPQGGAGHNSLQENLDSLGLYRMGCSEHGGWEAGRQHGEARNLVLTHF